MLENIQFFALIITIYCAPLLIAIGCVYLYRNFIDKNEGSYTRDFITGLIYLVGVREFLKNLQFKKRK